MKYIGNDWDRLLQDEYKKDYFQNLRYRLKDEYLNFEIYPKHQDIFNSLKMVPYDHVRVVILGQDPYHGPGQAHGFSFSVLPANQVPPSLVNIYKELQDDLGLYIPNNGYLIKWARQGVLLLNRTLTVRRGQANSHEKLGWQTFTGRIIEEINKNNEPLVFMLWGANARDAKRYLTNTNHLVLEAPHPSPLSAYRGFFGCKHFSRANDYLRKFNKDPIDWQIENI